MCAWLVCGVWARVLSGLRLVCGLTGVFLRLRAGLRRIRWVAQFGGGWLGRAGGWGCSCSRPRDSPSHCACVWSGGNRRVWWAPKVKVKSRASGGPRQRGVGLVGRRGGGLSVGCVCPGSLVADVARREPSRPGGVKPDRCCCGAFPREGGHVFHGVMQLVRVYTCVRSCWG